MTTPRRHLLRIALTAVSMAGLASCDILPDPGRSGAGESPNVEVTPPGDRRSCQRLAGPAVRNPDRIVELGVDGRPVIINIWASWCSPCLEEIPNLQTLHMSRVADVFGVNVNDNRKAAVLYLDQERITYPSMIDRDGSAVEAWDVVRPDFIPSSIIVDDDCRIAAVATGPHTLDQFEQIIARL